MKRFMRTVKGNEGSFPECIKAMSLGEMELWETFFLLLCDFLNFLKFLL